MTFLKFLWRIIRELLIISCALFCMIAASFIWPLLLLLILALPQTTKRLWNFAGTVKL